MAMLEDESMTQSTAPAAPPLTSNEIVAPDATESGVPSAPQTNGSAQNPEVPPVGIEGEETIWEGQYSFRNYLGRIRRVGLLSLVWVGLVVATWGRVRSGWEFLTIIVGACLLIFWVHLGFRLLRARRSHSFRLTSRRLFVST